MKKLANGLARILEYLVSVLLMFIVATALAQVFSRYILRNSITWTHELDIMLMIWSVFLGAAVGMHRKAHLRITILSDRFPAKAQRILLVLIDLFALLFLIILGVKGIEVIQSVEGTVLTSMDLPRGFMVGAASVGAALMILLFIPVMIEDVRGLSLQRKEGGEI